MQPARAGIQHPPRQVRERNAKVAALSPPPALLSSSSRTRVLCRAGFVLAFFGAELAGIAWGQGAPDHAFGFQMFNESSRLTIHLKREVRTKRGVTVQPLPEGRWRERDAKGNWREYAWQDRVRMVPLTYLDRSVHAPYGLDAQLFHLQAALEDVVARLPPGTRTSALLAEVETTRNGVPAGTRQLRAERP